MITLVMMVMEVAMVLTELRGGLLDKGEGK